LTVQTKSRRRPLTLHCSGRSNLRYTHTRAYRLGLRTTIGWPVIPVFGFCNLIRMVPKIGWKGRAAGQSEAVYIFMCTANWVETRTTRMRRRRLSQKRLADCCWLLFLLQGFNTLRWTEGRDANNDRGKRGASDAPPESETTIHICNDIYIYIFVTHVWCASLGLYVEDNLSGKTEFSIPFSVQNYYFHNFFFFLLLVYRIKYFLFIFCCNSRTNNSRLLKLPLNILIYIIFSHAW